MSAQSIFDFERVARIELHGIVRQHLASHNTTQMVEERIADFLVNLQHNLLLHKYPEWSVETELKVSSHHRTAYNNEVKTESPLLFSFADMASPLSMTSTKTSTLTTSINLEQLEEELSSEILPEQSLSPLHASNTYSANRWQEIANMEEDRLTNNLDQVDRVVETQCRHLLSFPDTLIALAVTAFTQCVQLGNEHEHTTSSILERNSLLINNDNTANTIAAGNESTLCKKVSANYINKTGMDVSIYKNEEILQSVVNSALRNFAFDKDLYFSRLADAFWIFALSQGISCVAFTQLHNQEFYSQEHLSTHTLQKEHSDCSYNDSHALLFTEVAAKQVVHTFVICAMQREVWQCILDRLKHAPFGNLTRTMSNKECELPVIMENVSKIKNINMKNYADNDNTARNGTRKFVVSLTNVLNAVIEGCTKRRRGLKNRTIDLHKISDNITNDNSSSNKKYNADKNMENMISTSSNQKVENFDRESHDVRGDANVRVICSCVHWQQTIQALFNVCNSSVYEIRNEVFSFLRTMLCKANNIKGVTNKDALLANCLFHTICIEMTCHLETPRSLLKVIFTELITPLFSAEDIKEKIKNIETNNSNSKSTHEPSLELILEYQEQQNILNNDDDDDNENEMDAKSEQNNTIDSVREQKDKTTISAIQRSVTTKKRIDDVVENILHEWSNKDVVLSGSLTVNATIMNSVMYVLQAIHQVHQQKLPSTWLTSLLDGVHVRLECVRSPELRDAALIISAAFASMFVEYEEIATGLMSNDQFAEALQGWLYEEELLIRHKNNNNNSNSNTHTDKQCYNHLVKNQNHMSNINGYLQNNNILSMTRHSLTDREKGQGKCRPPLELVLQDSITLSQHDARSAMLNPDEPYMFYTNLHHTLQEEEIIEEQQYLQWSKEQSQKVISYKKDHIDVSKADLVRSTQHDLWIETHLAHEMPSFGIQEHPLELSSNNSDIDNTLISFNNKNALTRMFKNKWLQSSSTPTLTLRGCYNVLMGIGRKPQAQQHEIEEDNELGLAQLHNVLQLHAKEYCRFNQTSQTNQVDSKGHNFHVCIAELNNMTSMLIPFLVSVELHAPADVLSRLHHIRFMCLVYVIILCPRMALYTLSNMVYGENYGVAQRVWMIDAIGYAAFALAHGTGFSSWANNENSYGDKQNTSEHNRSRSHDNIYSKVNSAFDNYDRQEENCTKHDRLIYPPIPSIAHQSQPSCCVLKSSSLETLLPFPSSGSRKKVAIVVSEGKKTRRWGYTIHPRSSDTEHHSLASTHHTYDTFQHKLIHNMLSDYAENFINVFLSQIETAPPTEQKKAHTSHIAKSFVNDSKNSSNKDNNNGDKTQSTHFSLEQHENEEIEQLHLTQNIRADKREKNDEDDNINNNMDHKKWSYTTYHFWQTSDPYTPSSILRVIVLIVQSLSHVRHVISSLCARHVHFIIATAHSHPHSAIRQLGWITLGEVMRAWCNAPPLFVATINSESNFKNLHDGNKNKSTVPSSQANLPEPTSSQRNGNAVLCEDHAVRLVHSSLLTPQNSNTTWNSHSLMLSASWLATYEAIHKLVKTTLQLSTNVESAETVNVMLLIISSLQELIESAHDRESYSHINTQSSPSIQIIH